MSDTISEPPILLDRAGLQQLGVLFSDAWLLRLEARGDFPKRISLGGRNTQWLRAEIIAFIQQRADERDDAAALRRQAVRNGGVAAAVAREQKQNGRRRKRAA